MVFAARLQPDPWLQARLYIEPHKRKMPNCRVKEAVIGKKCKDNFVLKWLKDVFGQVSAKSEVVMEKV